MESTACWLRVFDKDFFTDDTCRILRLETSPKLRRIEKKLMTAVETSFKLLHPQCAIVRPRPSLHSFCLLRPRGPTWREILQRQLKPHSRLALLVDSPGLAERLQSEMCWLSPRPPRPSRQYKAAPRLDVAWGQHTFAPKGTWTWHEDPKHQTTSNCIIPSSPMQPWNYMKFIQNSSKIHPKRSKQHGCFWVLHPLLLLPFGAHRPRRQAAQGARWARHILSCHHRQGRLGALHGRLGTGARGPPAAGVPQRLGRGSRSIPGTPGTVDRVASALVVVQVGSRMLVASQGTSQPQAARRYYKKYTKTHLKSIIYAVFSVNIACYNLIECQ